MIDTCRRVETPEGIEIALRVAGPVPRFYAWLLAEGASLSPASDEIFSRLVRDLLRLHQLVFAGSIFSGPAAPLLPRRSGGGA